MWLKSTAQHLLGCATCTNLIARLRVQFPESAAIARLAWHAGEGIDNKSLARSYRALPGFYLTHDLSDHILRHIYFGGDYEPEVSLLIRKLAQPGQVWWDIGANVGWFTYMLCQRVGPTGRVLAFEPNPRVSAWLMESKDLNSFSGVTICSVALSDREGESVLYVPSDVNGVTGGNGRPALLKHEDIEVAGFITVPIKTDTIDHLIGLGEPAPFGIKIDVEGWESAVFKGGSEMFKRTPPAIIISEVNHFPRCLSSPAALISQLQSLGYSAWHVETLAPYCFERPIDGSKFKDFVFVHSSYPELIESINAGLP